MATSRTGTTQWKRTRARLIREREHVCYWCRKILDPKSSRGAWDAIEIDHLVPVALAPELGDELTNLALVCHPCNRRKGAREAPEDARAPISRPGVTCAFHEPPTPTCPHSRVW